MPPVSHDDKTELYQRDLAGVTWVKASKSEKFVCECVEVAKLPDGARAVRDSANSEGPDLRFTAREWDAFQDGVRQGEFD